MFVLTYLRRELRHQTWGRSAGSKRAVEFALQQA
jgi:hypothetical protein